MKVELCVPKFEQLDYREALLGDPQTMSYNRGYQIDADNYDKETGCIQFPRSEWREWYDYFIANEPECYYAYIVCDGEFVGEVNLHRAADEDGVYDMGIVIEAKHRGKGISKPALEKLLEAAFVRLGAKAVRNDFEPTRIAALKLHKAVGFIERSRSENIVMLEITEDMYFSRNSKHSS